MSAERWQRLADDLTAAGVEHAWINTSTYPGGTSRYICWPSDDGSAVAIHDKWWNKNPDVWIGWQVHAENEDCILTRQWPITKKRSEVLAAVQQAFNAVAAR
jgi:hypothetical protein